MENRWCLFHQEKYERKDNIQFYERFARTNKELMFCGAKT